MEPGADATGNGERPGLGKRARLAILVAVLGGLAILGLVVGQRNRNAYDDAMTRVQVEAHAAGESVDVEAFESAWVQQTTGQWSGDEARPAEDLVPRIDGAEIVNYTVASGPTLVTIDYQVAAGNQDGCVRLNRTAGATQVLTADDVCVKAFPG